MDKLKKIFHKGDKQGSSSSAAAAPANDKTPSSASNMAGSGSGSGDDPENGVIMHTRYVHSLALGPITFALFPDETPKTCKNFTTLAKTGKYDNVIFHRIIKGFMIQGGDPTGTGRGGSSIYGGKFEDEFHGSLQHDSKGTLSMANSGPGTNGSQFFITLGPTPHLNKKHTVFGKVVQGMEIVDELGAVQTGEGDRPVHEVKIESCQIFSTKKEEK